MFTFLISPEKKSKKKKKKKKEEKEKKKKFNANDLPNQMIINHINNNVLQLNIIY